MPGRAAGKIKIIFLILIVLISGCAAPSVDLVKEGIGGPQLPAQTVTAAGFRMDFKPLINFPQVADSRPEQRAGTWNSKPVNSSADFALIADFGLRKMLKRKGFSFSETAPVTLKATLAEWTFELDNGQLESSCRLKTEVIDPAGQPLFSKTYSGVDRISRAHEPGVVEQSMGRAMGSILSEISADKELLQYLSAY